MHKQDTCQLLQECSSGIKMAVDAIREVLPNVKNEENGSPRRAFCAPSRRQSVYF